MALSGIELMEEIKLTYAIHQYSLKIILKYRNRLALHYHKKFVLKWQWHLILFKVVPVDLYPYKGLTCSPKHL